MTIKKGDKLRCIGNAGAQHRLTLGMEYVAQEDESSDLVLVGNALWNTDRFEVLQPKNEVTIDLNVIVPVTVELARVGEVVSLKVTGKLTKERVATLLEAVYA
jgi:hypothetical protein